MRKSKTRRSVDSSEFNRYLRSRKWLVTRKENQGGIVGIARKGKRWYTLYPDYLRIFNRRADSALGAAMEYNRQMLALFGEDTILCDVQAAMRVDSKGGSR